MQHGVTPTESRLAVCHRRRAIDVIAALISPHCLADRRIHAMQFEIIAANDDPGLPVRFYPVGRPEDLVSGFVFPENFAAAGLKSVEEAINGTGVCFPIEDQRRGFHRTAGFCGPKLLPSGKIQAIYIVVAGANHNLAVYNGSGGLDPGRPF